MGGGSRRRWRRRRGVPHPPPFLTVPRPVGTDTGRYAQTMLRGRGTGATTTAAGRQRRRRGAGHSRRRRRGRPLRPRAAGGDFGGDGRGRAVGRGRPLHEPRKRCVAAGRVVPARRARPLGAGAALPCSFLLFIPPARARRAAGGCPRCCWRTWAWYRTDGARGAVQWNIFFFAREPPAPPLPQLTDRVMWPPNAFGDGMTGVPLVQVQYIHSRCGWRSGFLRPARHLGLCAPHKETVQSPSSPDLWRHAPPPPPPTPPKAPLFHAILMFTGFRSIPLHARPCLDMKNVGSGPPPGAPWASPQPLLRHENSHAADAPRRRVSPHLHQSHRRAAITANGTSTTTHTRRDAAAAAVWSSPSAAAPNAPSAAREEGAAAAAGPAAAATLPLGGAPVATGGIGPPCPSAAAAAAATPPPRSGCRRASRGGGGGAEKPVPSQTSSAGGSDGSTSKPPNGAAAASAAGAGGAPLTRAPGSPLRRRRADMKVYQRSSGGAGDSG